MSEITQDSLWFNTPDSHTLCRAGGNGPDHPSQLYAIKKYVQDGMTFLDYGAGSGTTFEAIRRDMPWLNTLYYEGLDVIKKNVDWCNDHFGVNLFKYNPTIHKIDAPDQSWDVVYSRHVVDHMNSFEEAMDEHCRVARKLVIAVFWVPLSESPEHEIKHIIDQGKVYENEYTNSYSRKKVMEWIKSKEPEFELLELTEGVGKEVKGHDWVIVLRRKNEA